MNREGVRQSGGDEGMPRSDTEMDSDEDMAVQNEENAFEESHQNSQIEMLLNEDQVQAAEVNAHTVEENQRLPEAEQAHQADAGQQAEQFFHASIQVIRSEVEHIVELTLNELFAQIAHPVLQGFKPFQEALQEVQAMFQEIMHDCRTIRYSPISPDERERIALTFNETRQNPIFQQLLLTSRSLIRLQQAVLEKIILQFRNKFLALIAQKAARRPEPIRQLLQDLHRQICKTYQAHTDGCANRAQQALHAHEQGNRSTQNADNLENVAAQYGQMTRYAQNYLAILEVELEQKSEHHQRVRHAQEADRVETQGPANRDAQSQQPHNEQIQQLTIEQQTHLQMVLQHYVQVYAAPQVHQAQNLQCAHAVEEDQPLPEDEQAHRAEEVQQTPQFQQACIQVIRAELDYISQIALNELPVQIAQPVVQESQSIRKTILEMRAMLEQYRKEMQTIRTSPISPDDRELIARAFEKIPRNPMFQYLPYNSRSLIRLLQAVLRNIIEQIGEKFLAQFTQLPDLHTQLSATFQAYNAGCAKRAQQALQAHEVECYSAQHADEVESVASQCEQLARYAQNYVAILEVERGQYAGRRNSAQQAQVANRVGAQGIRSTIVNGNSTHALHSQASNTSMNAQRNDSSGTSRPSRKRARVPDESHTAPPSSQRKE